MKVKNFIIFILVFLFSLPIKLYAQNWYQKGSDILGEAVNDQFGWSVCMPDENTFAISAMNNDGNGSYSGHVRVYRWSGNCNNSWVQKGIDIDGLTPGAQSGWCISMPDSNTLAIGCPGYNSNMGMVRVVTWDGNTWVQKGGLMVGEAFSDGSGWRVFMPNINTVVIGAANNDGSGTNAGHIRIYIWDGLAWVQKGTDLDGEGVGDNFGFSVTMPDDNTVATGGYRNDGNGMDAGHVRVFSWNGSAWIQKGIDIEGEATGDQCGRCVSMPDENTIAVGAERNDSNGSNSGHVRIFKWNGTDWILKGNEITGNAIGIQFGWTVDMLDSNTIAIGAPYAIGTDGAIWIYDWNGTDWIQRGSEIVGINTNSYFGHFISMPNSNTVASGSYGANSFTGRARVYSFCNPSTSTISVVACNQYTSPSCNYNWNTSNVYTDTIPNKMNCDSIITVELTILNPTSGTDVQTACNSFNWIDGNTYTSNNNSATYNLLGGATNGCDSLITLNLTILNPTSGTDVQTACNSFNWIDGNTYSSNNNSATYNLLGGAANGCDSLVTLNLVINSANVSTTLIGNSINSNASGAIYQWLDCKNNMGAISGENSQSYTSLSGGSYAVEITENGCIDTSACISIPSTVGVPQNNFNSDFRVYPNPAIDKLIIESFSLLVGNNFTIYDAIGKLIQQGKIDKPKMILDISNLKNGLYVLVVNDSNNIPFVVSR